MTKDAAGMREIRARNKTGPLCDKRDDTHVGTIDEKYCRDFGVRSDMQLGTLPEKTGKKFLNELIHSNLERRPK